MHAGEPHIYYQATWSIGYITRGGPLVAAAAGAWIAAAVGAWLEAAGAWYRGLGNLGGPCIPPYAPPGAHGWGLGGGNMPAW